MNTLVLDHAVDAHAERLVFQYKQCLELAITEAQVEVVEEQINSFDADNPTLYRPLLRRLQKPLARHRRRVQRGHICMPIGVKFPQRMIKKGSEALVVDGQGYTFFAREGYIPVWDK